MKFGSLFSGIGGMDLGLERAGMQCTWQVEIDDYCTKVLTKHWPDVPKYKDIRDVGKENLKPVDLICGGFPCQPFSVAGKRKGTADDRHLWPEMLRVISELKPAWVLGENVPGIIPIFLDQAISDLEAEGYSCEAYVLPASAFDAPHRRDRLFIVAHSRRGEQQECGNTKQSFPGREGKAGSTNQIGRSGEHDRKEVMADSENERVVGRKRVKRVNSSEGKCGGAWPSGGRTDNGCEIVGNSSIEQINERNNQSQKSGTQTSESRNPISEGGVIWQIEPNVGRVAHGVPHRVDRLRGLGNAVVPQVAEFIGRQIMGVD
jgi:DNA (cytosine-5)-methyltransferase 1